LLALNGRVISVTAPLWIWTGDSTTWHFITIPDDVSDEIRAHGLMELRGFRSVRVQVSINDVTWRTSVFPMKSGGYFLPVKADVRRKACIAAGDEVTAEIELL